MDKVIIVTGSTKGIGYGIAKHFDQLGATVILNSRSAVSSDFLAASGFDNKCQHFQCDVTVPSACRYFLNKIASDFGKIDHIVCNVGSGKSAEPGQETFKHWDDSLRINLRSVTSLVEALEPELLADLESICCISSICGINVIAGAPIPYSVSKAALNFYIKSISKILQKSDVRINAVAPGNVMFSGSTWEKKMMEDPDKVQRETLDSVAMNRFGNADEISKAVEFLLSTKSSFITGQTLVVDGGQVV